MKLYFSRKELNPNDHPVDEATLLNLEELAKRLSVVREAYGRALAVTSGLRSREDQERIYKHAARVPYGSQHLLGKAADLADRDGSLTAFCVANLALLERAQLWMEDPSRTRGWVHLQTSPPTSGRRIFLP